jgi:hypothetical protein
MLKQNLTGERLDLTRRIVQIEDCEKPLPETGLEEVLIGGGVLADLHACATTIILWVVCAVSGHRRQHQHI